MMKVSSFRLVMQWHGARRGTKLVKRSLWTNCQLWSGSELHPSHRPDVVDLAFEEYPGHCTSSGTPKSPVIIAHGLLGSKSNWHSLAKVLNKSTGRKIVTVDLRGHGESAHHPSFKYVDHRDDLEHFLITRQLSKTIMVGHSLGGRAMMYTALHKPEVVEKLVVVDVSPVFTPQYRVNQHPRTFVDAMINIKWDPNLTLSEARKSVDQHMASISDDVTFRQFLLTNLVKTAAGEIKWRVDLLAFKDFLDRNMLDVPLGIYTGPTLFICGEKSPYLPRERQGAVKELFPKAEFAYIPGASHFVHSEKPKEFLETITPFLNS